MFCPLSKCGENMFNRDSSPAFIFEPDDDDDDDGDSDNANSSDNISTNHQDNKQDHDNEQDEKDKVPSFQPLLLFYL